MTDRRKVLVIDDNDFVLDLVRQALEPFYDVLTTTHIVGNARHLVSCDLVIIDYHMPGFTGSTVLESMRTVARSRSSARPCQFFLYTSDASLQPRYAELGFDGVLTDKGNQAALARQVQSVFRKSDIAAMRTTKRPP